VSQKRKSRKPRRTFSREFKIEAMKLIIEQGVPVVQAARDLGVSATVLHGWKRKYLEDRTMGGGNGGPTSDQEEIRRLRRELAQVRLERDILKKAAVYLAEPLKRGTRS